MKDTVQEAQAPTEKERKISQELAASGEVEATYGCVAGCRVKSVAHGAQSHKLEARSQQEAKTMGHQHEHLFYC